MEKQIGFRRNIYLSWLDATAAMCSETSDAQELRARLDPIVEEQVLSKENRQYALGILINIWVNTRERYPDLREEAVELYTDTSAEQDRVWLHYGLTVLAYEFFRLGMIAIGQLTRYGDPIGTRDLERHLAAEVGQIGGLKNATERLIFSLRNWGLLIDTGKRYAYAPIQRLTATNPAIERWMLQVALAAHPAQDLPFADLVRLPELFPFRFTLSVDDLRRTERFEVHRQGMGWDMVRLAS
jgi:hypothetical protein